MSRKHRSRKHQARKQPKSQHIVVRMDGEHGGLEPDCPICALLAAQGQEVLAYDPESMEYTPESVATLGPVTGITLLADAAVARHLGGGATPLEVPQGMRVGEFLFAVRFVVPELAKAFPEGGLELQVDGHRLDLAAPVPAGAVTLAAARPAMS
jgi:hypothetical protein